MIASENGKEDVVKHLLLRGANVNLVTEVTNITNFLFHNHIVFSSSGIRVLCCLPPGAIMKKYWKC